MSQYLPVVIGAFVVFAGLLLMVFGLRANSRDEVSQRLQVYALPGVEEAQRASFITPVRERELTGSFSSRIILPAFRWFARILGRMTPASAIEDLGRKLAIAGNPLGLGPREFYGIRMAFTLLGFWTAFLFLSKGLNQQNLVIALFCLILCLYLPKNWLTSRVKSRQDKIRKGLPDALDMLSICAAAGLGFDQALQRVSEYWKTPLGIEFGRVINEMEMGISRQDALRGLAHRMDVAELSSFIAVILQSDQLGMSIADTLTSQANQMRVERRFRAQEQARKIPLKMLFPMLLLILPAMFAVVLGPAIPSLTDMFTVMRGGG